ncbi:MAG: Rpn family recombination-promoting nuclease/putative transposase [Defluviitaleaceae bacterium]|nr:Rpn family recombination-promoting nuclease/putative transposase [Defluviitaleaceae bacterium]
MYKEFDLWTKEYLKNKRNGKGKDSLIKDLEEKPSYINNNYGASSNKSFISELILDGFYPIKRKGGYYLEYKDNLDIVKSSYKFKKNLFEYAEYLKFSYDDSLGKIKFGIKKESELVVDKNNIKKIVEPTIKKNGIINDIKEEVNSAWNNNVEKSENENELNNTLKRNYKDTLFRYTFNDKKHFCDLYKELTGKTLNPDDIEPFNLSSTSINRGMENDSSYITKDNKLIILVEHQSSMNKNMAFRMNAYYVELVRLWEKINGIDFSKNPEIDKPKPEFYIVYNKITEYNKEKLKVKSDPKYLHYLVDEIKVVDINYEKLKNKENTNVLAGYAYLVNEVTKQTIEIKKTKPKLSEQDKANIFEIARIRTLENGYLKGIADKEVEAVSFKVIQSYSFTV